MYNYCTYTIILTIDCTTFPNTQRVGILILQKIYLEMYALRTAAFFREHFYTQ